jgi:hypothetical protein
MPEVPIISAAAALVMSSLFMEFNLLGNDASHHGCVVPTSKVLSGSHYCGELGSLRGRPHG